MGNNGGMYPMCNTQVDAFACPIPRQDTERICTQLQAVRRLMSDGLWRTIAEVAQVCGCSEPGASARLRELRRFPYHLIVNRRRAGPGLYQYQVRTP